MTFSIYTKKKKKIIDFQFKCLHFPAEHVGFAEVEGSVQAGKVSTIEDRCAELHF